MDREDIVERLRSVTDLQRETERSSYEQDDQLALEAADTITRLTAEIERLRTELEKCRQIILETAMEKHP
jgi:phage host-nuclease inhibitor protein Gam